MKQLTAARGPKDEPRVVVVVVVSVLRRAAATAAAALVAAVIGTAVYRASFPIEPVAPVDHFHGPPFR